MDKNTENTNTNNNTIQPDKVELQNQTGISTNSTINDFTKLASIKVPITKETLSLYSSRINAIFNHSKIKKENEIYSQISTTPAFDTASITKSDYKIKKIESIENLTTISNNKDTPISYILNTNDFFLKETDQDITLNKSLLTTYIKSLKNLGTCFLLMDIHYLTLLKTFISEYINLNEKTNLMLKIYIIDKMPFTGVISIQKFDQNNKIEINNIKTRLYEVSNDETFSSPMDFILGNFESVFDYLKTLYYTQVYLSSYKLGESVKINIRKDLDSSDSLYTFTIVDSANEEKLKENKVSSIIVMNSQASDFFYLAKEGHQSLLEQIGASRMILIKPNSFFLEDMNAVKLRASSYISQFKPYCFVEEIPIMLIQDNREDKYEIYKDKNFYVYDNKEKSKTELYRTLVHVNNPREIINDVHIYNLSKKDSKAENLIALPTHKHYDSKKEKSILAEDFLPTYQKKFMLSSIYFLDLKSFPEKKLELLSLNSNTGLVPFFYDKLVKSNINLTCVEQDENIRNIGSKYFGFENSAKNFLNKKASAISYSLDNTHIKEKYDIILIEHIIGDLDTTKEGISPPSAYYEAKFLKALVRMLSVGGVVVLNIKSSSSENYKKAMNKIKEVFPLIFFIDNNDESNRMHYLVNRKSEECEILFLDYFQPNLMKLNDLIVSEILSGDQEFMFKRLVRYDE